MLARLRPWAPYAAVGVLSLLLFRQCGQTRAAESSAAASDERARLQAAGQIVVAPVPDLAAALEQATRENAALRDALAAAQRAAPDARPVAVVRAETAPAPVQAPPTPTVAPCPGQPACLLAAGDSLRLSVDEVVLATRAGNRLLVGTVAATRVVDSTLLLRAPFSAPLTEARADLGADPEPGWGVGPWVGAGSGGWAAGVAVASPSWRLPLVGWRAEALAGGGIGSGVMVAASVIVRP